LTGLANRRRFSAALDEWTSEARASGSPLVLLILDLDHFKAVNDRHGHAVGDACLRAFAGQLEQAFGSPDELVARLGGEEFGVLLRGCTIDAAVARAEAFRTRVAASPLVLDDVGALTLGVSIGVAAYDPLRFADSDAFYHASDVALYRAKAGGRNTVRMAETA